MRIYTSIITLMISLIAIPSNSFAQQLLRNQCWNELNPVVTFIAYAEADAASIDYESKDVLSIIIEDRNIIVRGKVLSWHNGYHEVENSKEDFIDIGLKLSANIFPLYGIGCILTGRRQKIKKINIYFIE